MATSIPACGIDAYMKGQIIEYTPKTFRYRLAAWMNTTNSIMTFVGSTVLMAGVFMFTPAIHAVLELPAPTWNLGSGVWSIFFGLFVSLIVFFPLMMVSTFTFTSFWRRYSLTDFFKKHDMVLDRLTSEVRSIRKLNPEAEFEVAVLEKIGVDDIFGLVLFQVMESLNKSSKFEEGSGEPLLILDEQGNSHSFGEAYVPATAI